MYFDEELLKELNKIDKQTLDELRTFVSNKYELKRRKWFIPKIYIGHIEHVDRDPSWGNYFIGHVKNYAVVMYYPFKIVSPIFYDVIFPSNFKETGVFIAKALDRRYYLFKIGRARPISMPFDDFEAKAFYSGLPYFIVTVGRLMGHMKKYLMNIEGKVSRRFGYINHMGLVEGVSDYYAATGDDFVYYAIFHKSGKKVTPWFMGDALKHGVLLGKSQYYAYETLGSDKKIYVGKIGKKKVIGPFKEVLDWGFVDDPQKKTMKVIGTKVFYAPSYPPIPIFTVDGEMEIEDF